VPARNIYHDAVVRALTADGWTITHDPLTLSFGGKDLFVDLGAERAALAAEKEGRRIAVEIQHLLGRSLVRSLEEAVGQYRIYRAVLEEREPGRLLYMAVTDRVSGELLAEQFGQFVVERLRLRIMVFDEHQQRVVRWTG